MSEMAGNSCDWHRAAQGLLPDQSQLPSLYWRPESYAPYRGYSRELFFLISFSALSQVPQGCGYSKSSGRPRVAYAWNVRILEKIFPNVSRRESREEMKTAAKWSLIKRRVSSRPKPTLKFLTEGAVTKKGACQSGMCVPFWEAVFWRHNTNHSAQGSII